MHRNKPWKLEAAWWGSLGQGWAQWNSNGGLVGFGSASWYLVSNQLGFSQWFSVSYLCRSTHYTRLKKNKRALAGLASGFLPDLF